MTTEPAPKVVHPKLRIAHYNADGLLKKTPELSSRLKSDDIDIMAIQETKLHTNASPRIDGYVATGRTDRTGMKFGGLLFYVKDSIIFSQGQKSTSQGTETSTINVKTGSNKWLKITNIYVPPSNTTHPVVFDPRHVPTSADSIIIGDFNGHTPLWDPKSPVDSRGEDIEDWATGKNLQILNSGAPTHINRATGNESTPDISLVSTNLTPSCSWSVGDQLGSSDHLPITIEMSQRIPHQPVFGSTARWRKTGVCWKSFRDDIESTTQDLPPEPSLANRVTRFNQILTDAGYKHVGKSKPGPRTRSYMTPTVRAAIKKRNHLRRKAKLKQRGWREEWLQSCEDVNAKIADAKEQCWHDLLADTMTEADDAKIWRVIKSLNGSPDGNAPNEAMVVNGKTFTSDQSKATKFAQHYANVSRHSFTKEDRNVNRSAKKCLDNHHPQDDIDPPCPAFTMTELKRAITKMKRKGAEGPDQIPPSFLKELGPSALTELLGIFQKSFDSGFCPQIWRSAIILPLLKSGKPPSALESYRPISLTSCVVKLLERMINDRMFNLAETKGWLNPQQAGFRKGRACEDQIARIIQSIEDGFQQKKMERTVLVLLDFSKAYDTVWREKLITSMKDKGVPMSFILWIWGFLQNRSARVRFNGSLGRSVKLRQGLPQGAVLSPILFLFYINNLADILPQDTLNSLFADDVATAATRRSFLDAQTAVQKTVDVVSKWAKEWKVQLNATKSEVSFFSNSTKDKDPIINKKPWLPTISIDDKTIRYEPTPRLLGVILDRQLTFGPQVKSIEKRVNSKIRMLSSLANSKYGWKKPYLKRIFTTLIKSVINYAGFAWLPGLAETHVKALEKLQNRAIRSITGHTLTSPIEALYLEAGIPNIRTDIARMSAIAAEKCLRLPPDHPRRMAYDQQVRNKGTGRKSWGTIAKAYILSAPASTELRKQLNPFATPPWIECPNLTILPDLPGIANKDDDKSVIINAAMTHLRSLNPTITIYTDGSASSGTEDGGNAAIVSCGEPTAPTILSSHLQRGAKFTCSYEEELEAMELAAIIIRDTTSADDIVVVATDSQSLCTALVNANRETDAIRSILNSAKSRTTITWIPGHCDIPGNEAADRAAKQATTSDGNPRPISYSCAVSRAKRAIRDPPITHERVKETYREFSALRDATILSRHDQVTLSRIRSGHHLSFRAYQNRLDPNADPSCPRCDAPTHDVSHWIQDCPGTEATRRDIFGEEMYDGLTLLCRHPTKSLSLARRTLLEQQQ